MNKDNTGKGGREREKEKIENLSHLTKPYK